MLHKIITSQESPYQGAARAGYPSRAEESEVVHDKKAHRTLTDKSIINCSKDSKSLVTFLAMRQVQVQARKMNKQITEVITFRNSGLGQTQCQCLQLIAQNSEVKPGSQTMVRISDHGLGLD